MTQKKSLFYPKDGIHPNKKFHIRETLTLSTDADNGTDTNWKRKRNLSIEKKKKKLWGGGPGEGGRTNERPQTNHVITGPMTGHEKNRMGRGQVHDNTWTLQLLDQLGPEGQVGENPWSFGATKLFGNVDRIIFPCRPIHCTLGLVIIPSNHISLPQGPVGGPVPVGGDAGVPRRLPLPHGPGPHGPGPGLHSPHPRGQGLPHSQVMAAQAEQPRDNLAVLTCANG